MLRGHKHETIEICIDGLVIDLEVIGIIDYSIFPSFSYNYPKAIIQNDQLIGNCTLDSCDIQAVSVLGLYNVKKTLENNKIDLDYRSDEVDARFFEVIILILFTGSLITVGTAVANFISMSINARYYNIGLLKALGYPNHLIKKLFMFECMLISILSSLLGWALSLAGNLMMKKYIQMVLLDGSGVVLASNFGVETIIGIILVFFIALLFAYFTVNKIASIRPFNALRGRID